MVNVPTFVNNISLISLRLRSPPKFILDNFMNEIFFRHV
jgi:hypothetical protein